MIAALYVDETDPYADREGVDLWGVSRDARLYPGPYPVIAHPPCQRWGRFYRGSPLVIARSGIRKTLGDDGGCFRAALSSVRQWGGVLEHPWQSKAWAEFGLIMPPRGGSWMPAGDGMGFTCCVEQGRYGHQSIKPTLLYAVDTELPELDWAVTRYHSQVDLFISAGIEPRRRLIHLDKLGGGHDHKDRIHTPPEFLDLLIRMATSARPKSQNSKSLLS